MTIDGRQIAGRTISRAPTRPAPAPAADQPVTIGISPAVGMTTSVPTNGRADDRQDRPVAGAAVEGKQPAAQRADDEDDDEVVGDSTTASRPSARE